jgi:hypothetical protein
MARRNPMSGKRIAQETSAIAVLLSCKHEVYLRAPYPKIGDEQYCVRCTTYHKVTAMGHEYQVACNDSHCRFAHKYGDNLDAAERSASKHVMRYTSHTVNVYQSGKLLTTIAQQDSVLPEVTTPYGGVLRRRSEIAKNNQKLLRDVLDGTKSGGVE